MKTITIYFKEKDEKLYEEITKEAIDTGRSLSDTVKTYLWAGIGRMSNVMDDGLCDKCKGQLY